VGVWGVTGLFVAGVVGAGFATGKELVVFFVRYGRAGLAGVVWAALLLCAGTGLILESCARHGVSSYGELLKALEPRLSGLFDGLYSLFLLVGTSVMFAGLAAVGRSSWQSELLRFGSALLVYLLLRRGTGLVIKVSGWIAPLLVGFLCLMGVVQLANHGLTWAQPFVERGGLWKALEAGTLYACYNLGFALAFLAASHQYLKTRGQRWAMAAVGSGVLGLSMLLLYLALGTLGAAELGDAFPLFHLLSAWGAPAQRVFLLLLWCAMFTTAAANSLALASRLAALPWLNWPGAALVAVGTGTVLSHLGFSWLIQMAYPILGLVGLWLMAQLLWHAAA